MKRSEIRRKTPLRSKAGLKRTGRLRPMSKKRKAEMPARADTRSTVLARDRGCVADDMVHVLMADGRRVTVPHGQIGGRAPLEVHEIRGGADRSTTYLEPDWCIALCPVAHDWIGSHRDDAVELGLLARIKTPEALAAAGVRRFLLTGRPGSTPLE